MQSILQFLKSIAPIKLAIGIVILFVFSVICFVSMVKMGKPEFAVLYSDLDINDSAKITQELDKHEIIYATMRDESVIKVRKSEVVSTRLTLAQVGLPNIGSVVGYEIFDKEDGIGSTNFSQNIKLVRALEGELSRTISAFDQVIKARVHLVMMRREIFSREKAEPRASVVLKLKPNRFFAKSEIEGISHLLVTSVPDLEMKNITIVDISGKALKVGSSEESQNYSSNKNDEYRIAEENRLNKVIVNMLENTIGVGKVKAQVNLDMNFDRIVTNSELYDPDSAIIRSSQISDEKEQSPMSNSSNVDVSVANNIYDNEGSDEYSNKWSITEKSDQTINYEISRVVKNHISETGVINQMSVAVLVDGNYKINPKTSGQEYSPLAQEDLDKITNLIKVAVGFNSDRNDKIEVINMRFLSNLESDMEDQFDWIKDELPNIIKFVIWGVFILVIFMFIRPVILRLIEFGREIIGGNSSNIQGSPSGSGFIRKTSSDIANNNKISKDSINKNNTLAKVNEVTNYNPEDLIKVLRKWLNEDDK